MNIDQKMNIYYFLRNMYHFLRNYPVYLSYFIWGSANSGAEKAIWQIYELHATHTQLEKWQNDVITATKYQIAIEANELMN